MAVSEEIKRQMLEEAYSVTPNYDIDYNDSRFGKVESDKKQALTELEQTYAGMLGQSDKFYNDQIQASKDWADKQTEIQNAQTDFAIEQIEQQKDKAHKDYLKEQSASYVDWQKQSDRYGVNAEKMAASGLWNTGYSETSQVSMYNAYQNRVAMARESYNNAVLNYNNSIKDAQLQNNAALAEIAYNALQQQLELSLEGFQYKNQLLLDQANKKLEIDNMYYNRYQDVLQQINTENAMKEDIRQYNETMKWQTEQAELDRLHDEHMAEVENAYQVKRDEATRAFQAAQAELDRKHDLALVDANTKAAKEKADHEHELAMKELEQKHKNDLAILDKELANEKALLSHQNALSKTIGSGGGSSSSSGGSNVRGLGAYGTVYAVNKDDTSNYQVKTNYYQGSKNKDCQYGTFSNGYQPNNVNGKKLKKTGDSIDVSTQYKYGSQKGQKVTVKQNIWVDTDGNRWYWDGVANKYKPA